MEEFFLSRVWKEVSALQKTHPNLTVVLPSVRNSFYLKVNALLDTKKGSIRLPVITTLSDLCNEIDPTPIASPIAAQVLLFKAYKRVMGASTLSFTNFLPRAKSLLADFNEIDLQLVNPNTAFSNLAAIQELAAWNVESNITDSQREYNIFWQQLLKVYESFQSLLDTEGLSYTGKKFRKIANSTITPDRYYIFAGFNVLSNSEQQFIAQFLQNGKLILERDHSFAHISDHEANISLPEIVKPSRDTVLESTFIKNPPRISKFSSQTNLSQILGLCKVLEKIPPEDFNNCCIIVPDKDMIPGLIKHLPTNISEYNLTMGYPISHFPWHHYLKQIEKALPAHENKYINSADVLPLFHPPGAKASTVPIIKESQLHVAELPALMNPAQPAQLLVSMLASATQEIGPLLSRWLKKYLSDSGESPYYIKLVGDSSKRILEDLSGLGPEEKLSPKNVLHWILNEVDAQSIPVKGDPKKGLQIMGMLEARNLDFEHVFVLNANEGMLPATPNSKSLIPNDLRRYLKLPTIKDKEQLFGFYFYRLFYRAKHVHLFYNETTDAIKSRYVRQLEHEFESIAPISHTPINFVKSPKKSSGEQLISMSSDAQEKTLDFLTTQGLSASALADLITCPKNFYLRYILRTPEKEVVGKASNSGMGNIFHKSIETAFEKWKNNSGVVSSSELPALKEIALAKATELIEAEFNTSAPLSGNAYVMQKQVAINLDNFFQFQSKDLVKDTLTILGIEKDLAAEIPFKWRGKELKIKLKGSIDRLQSRNGQIEIIDYKAGKVVASDLKKTLPSLFETATNRYALQLSFYRRLCELNGMNVDRSCIYSAVNSYHGLLDLQLKDVTNFSEEFDQQIAETFTQFLEMPELKHNATAMYCEYCT